MLRCMICDNPIKYRVLSPCNHSDLCLQCYLRSIICYNNHCCAVCTKEYSSYPIVTTNTTPDVDYQSFKSQIALLQLPVFNLLYNDQSVLNEIMSYMSFKCTFCKERFNVFNSVDQLKSSSGESFQNLNSRIIQAQNNFGNHVKNVHHQFACFICLNSNRFLPCEAVSYSKRFFDIHRTEMHKKCPCCSYMGFDAHELEVHMNEAHVRCDICLHLYNKVLWFRNESDLLNHYKKEHYVCYHPECIDSLIAFPTQLDLIQHLSKEHHEKVDLNGVPLGQTETNEKLAKIHEEEEKEKRARIIEANQKFINKLKEIFKNDESKVQNLRQNAILLINNRVTVQDFYKKFCEICGDDKKRIFTDMVAIMPDPEKRAELLRLSENLELNEENQSKKSFPKSVSMPSVKNVEEEDKVTVPAENENAKDKAQFFELRQNRPNLPPPPQSNNQSSKKKKKPKKMVISDF